MCRDEGSGLLSEMIWRLGRVLGNRVLEFGRLFGRICRLGGGGLGRAVLDFPVVMDRWRLRWRRFVHSLPAGKHIHAYVCLCVIERGLGAACRLMGYFV